MKIPSPQKKLSPKTKLLALLLLVNSVLFSVIYFLIANAGFAYILYVYTAAVAILALAYVIYNRGFSSKNVTPQMLPDTMSDEEKQQFIAEGARRLSASRWVITLLFPLVLAIALDMMYLYLLPMLTEMFR